jgi:uncharacterized protein YkwD
MARTQSGRGYWLVGRDGHVYAFGSARSYGSGGSAMAGQAAAGIVAAPGKGYWIPTQWGGVNTGTSSGMKMDPNLKTHDPEKLIANELVSRINKERTARGLHTVTVDPLLSSSAAAWAHYLAWTGQFAHQDIGSILNRSNGRFVQVGENLYGGGGAGAVDAGTAHVTLMRSAIHRETMLLPEQRMVGVGAACFNGSLIVVQDFASAIPLKSHPVPPVNPIASPNEGGAGC